MNHEAQATIKGDAQAKGRGGVHMSVSVNIVVPFQASFGPPKKLVVDSSKVTVTKGFGGGV
jgi:hypothetical protein